MTNLKDYIDFITTLIHMDEVRSGKFPLPKEITFQLEELEHQRLYKEVTLHFKDKSEDIDISESFEITVHDVILKYVNE